MSEFAAYVMYVNRPDLLKRALDSFPDLWDNLTIVDNSVDGMPKLFTVESGIKCFCPPVPLSYSQSMNWMLKDATEKKVDFILHFHSDAKNTNPVAVSQLLDYARQLRRVGMDRWACLWTLYDVLWCLNPVAARDVGGWDTTFPNYFVDQVQKMRWKARGWETIDTHIEGITHEGSATIRSDPKLEFINGVTFPLYKQLYRRMWAGDPGKEKYDVPFGRADLFHEFQNLE